ncbi:cation:proton antiporter [Candidatus Micrarchaeota archaeon]|nr:cation:proton antiporter [Candidatus Micrarchaeota archaeon]
MMDPFMQFASIILLVLGVSIITKLLKQPLIIGYILSGIIAGPFFLDLVHESEILSVFSEMGIAFLLFIVGLHLSPKVIREVGKISLVAGIGQIAFTSIIGFIIGMLLGFPVITSIYLAIALTFSSTIIIMKLLSDKDALEKLYGKISIGFLLVQDLVAILILMIVSSMASGTGMDAIVSSFMNGTLLTLILIPFSIYILPRLTDYFAKSQEFLFVFIISWGFGLALLFLYAGFSIEVGALVAGVMLSMSPYSYEISSKLRPLRDFFIMSFFIILGSQMAFGDISSLLVPAIIFSAFILIGNPFIVMILMGLLGYTKKTGFMAGLTVAQISEFSLILIALGIKSGSLPQEIMSFVTIIGLLTIAGSTYMIIYSDSLFKRISWFLTIFERKNARENNIPKKKHDYILLGYNRIGFSIIRAFSKITKRFVVVDYNPGVVKELQNEGIDAVYGDVDNSEFLADLDIHKTSVVVSTIPEKETNRLILEVLDRNDAKPIVILTARQLEDALELYDAGATYVILPHFLGGEFAAQLIRKAGKDNTKYQKERKREIKILKQRLKIKHRFS